MNPPGRKKSRAEHTREMRLDIQRASLELFLENGYKKTTTRQIIQKVGILNGSLYNIYKSKDEIFADLATTVISEAAVRLSEILPKDSSPEVKVCIPFCVQIRMAFINPRVTELVCMGCRDSGGRQKVANAYRTWSSDNERNLLDMKSPMFDIRMDAALGALFGILDSIGSGTVHEERDLMILTCRSFLGTFALPCDNVEEIVDITIDILGDNVEKISGFRI